MKEEKGIPAIMLTSDILANNLKAMLR